MALNNVCNVLNSNVQAFSLQAAKVVKSAWALELTFTVISDSLKLLDLNSKMDKVARPALDMVAASVGIISTVRVFQTLHYAFSGGLTKDLGETNVAKLVTEAAFAVARTLSAIQFAASLGFIDFDELAKRAQAIGGSVGKGFVDTLRATHVMHGMFILGLAGLAYQSVEGICKGENLVSNSFGAVSFTTDAALLALGLLGAANPHMVAALGIVAGTTGLACFLTNQEAK